MYGFIVTTHFNNYDIIKKCLDLIFNNIPNESFVILYVNETSCNKVLNIKNDYFSFKDKFEVIYIKNQLENGGLTGTWNQGINYLLDKKDFDCKVITILGHDTYINKEINHLLDAALNAENNKNLKYFGPLYKNYAGKTDELWQDELYYKNYSNKFIIGSLFTFPVYSLVQNKLDKDNFFDADRFPFGYNDIDWYNRFKKIGGSGIIISQCIIDHKYKRTWMEYDKNLKNYNINHKQNLNESQISDNQIEKLYMFNKINELNFNWKSYLLKNRDLQNKGIVTQKDALNHYFSIGKYQNRPY